MAERRIEPPDPLTGRLRAELEPRLAELGRFLRGLDAFAAKLGLSATDSYHISLVVDEVVTNIISHGLAPGQAGSIVVDIRYRRPELEIEISDPGRPFDPNTAPPPDLETALADRRLGGLGIHLVRSIMDSMAYRYHAGRNHLTLVKRLGKDG